MVVIAAPSACAAKTVQDFTERPFMSMVQAPQWEVSQPICAPVRPSLSRSTWIRSSRGSASTSWASPFTVSVSCIFFMGRFPLRPWTRRARWRGEG